MVRVATDKHVHANNMHAEGVIKNFKGQPDRKVEGGNLPMYIFNRWKDDGESLRMFVFNSEMTDDAKEDEEFMTTNAMWGTGKFGAKAEAELRDTLESIFLFKTGGKVNYKKWHDELKNHIQESGVGSIKGMGEDNFRKWMGGKRDAKKNIKAAVMTGFRHFAEQNKLASVEAEGGNASEGEESGE